MGFKCGIVGLPPGVALAFSLVLRARDLLIGFIGLAVWHAVETSAQVSFPLPAFAKQASRE